MRKIGILFLSFITALNLSNAQSEEETIEFLNSKLSYLGAPMYNFAVTYRISTPIDSSSN